MVARLARRLCTSAMRPLHEMLASSPEAAHAASLQALLKSQFGDAFHPAARASRNFESILGVDPDAVISLHAISFLCDDRDPHKLSSDVNTRIGTWQNTPRGKHVFIAGLGGFDIGRAYSEILGSRLRSARPQQMKDLLRLVRPTELVDLRRCQRR